MATPDTLACPTCGRPVSVAPDQRPPTFPFCSERCRTRDLGAWAEGRHVIAGPELPLDGYEEP